MSSTAASNTKSEPIQAFLVKIVERAHSSGAEHWYERVFLSLKGASDYLKQYLEDLKADYYYPEEWDAEDMGCEFPSGDIFEIDRLTDHLEKQKKNFGYDSPIWGPESQYEAQRPREIFLKPTKVWP